MPIEHLSDLALIRINGDDAENFLQGQLSNDIRHLSGTSSTGAAPCWQYTAYCNPKGRTLALMQLWRNHGAFYALLDSDLVAPITQRLRMYVMRSKVEIEHLQDTAVLGIITEPGTSGTQLSELGIEQRAISQLVAAGNRVVDTADGVALGVEAHRQMLVFSGGMPDGASTLITDATHHHWHAANIVAGIPQVNAGNSEQFIPQMINLDVLGAINFKKGCYTGQEIVARMHYLGNLKQRMYRCDISGNTHSGDLSPNQKVYLNNDLGKVAGTIVDVDIEGQQALAVLRIEHANQPLYLDPDCELRISDPQPYEVPN